MKPSLQLRISQQLTMTPQLQQAIKLLQLSSLELQTEIQQALESNPMLEMSEDHGEPIDGGVDPRELRGQKDERHDDQDGHGEEHVADTSESLEKHTLSDEIPVDAKWEDWDLTPMSGGNGSGRGSDDDDYEPQGQTTESLQDHLMWQLNLTPFSDNDRAIARTILDSVDDTGYLRTSLEDIGESLRSDDIESDEVLAVLHRLQQFDPPGVCARDLRECLLIQLKQWRSLDPVVKDAINIVDQYLDVLASRDSKTIMRKLKIDETQLKAALTVIQSLNPRPGTAIGENSAEYVTPDVIVRKKAERWVVELNPEIAPRLRINASYASLIQRTRTASDNTFLRNHLQEAKWFIKSLRSRNETLLRVATAIVEQQIGFFELGEVAMKPMVLADIAQMLEMHESTISRVTTQKYMHTPRGIFELKYFFSSHVSTTSGGEASSTSIRAKIKKLIESEETTKPLSDSQIAKLLGKDGIVVARRTVAKYREAMSIRPSSERKSLV